MCFRGVEAIQYYRNACEHRDDPDSPYADPESVDIGPQRWRFLCGHELQPLKYCLESVRLEFLHLAEDLDLFLDQGIDDEFDQEIFTHSQGMVGVSIVRDLDFHPSFPMALQEMASACLSLPPNTN